MLNGTCVHFAVVTVCVILFLFASSVSAAPNLVRNPSFEIDADRNGVPDNWVVQGDPKTVTQTLTIGKSRDGKRCALLNCTNFVGGNPSAHAMIAQMGVSVTRGKLYRVTLWARAEELLAGGVGIALSNTRPWGPCGLSGSFSPTHDWRRFEFMFKATRTVAETTRFQMWYASAGKLWVDDVTFTEVEGSPYKPGHIHPSAGHTNLIPNGGFECGTAGWGTTNNSRVGHWGGGLNKLIGVIDNTEAHHGKQSLRIDLSPETVPVSYFDWFDLFHTRVQIPLTGHQGFVEFTPGQTYTFSVYAKARTLNTQAFMAVRGFSRNRIVSKNIRVGTEWQRYTVSFVPKEKWGFAMIGPDMRRVPRGQAVTVWLDDLQLEKGNAATDYQPREDLELGLETDRAGNVFDWREPVKVRVSVANGADERKVRIELSLTDFTGKIVWKKTLNPTIPAKGRVEEKVEIAPDDTIRGPLFLHAKSLTGGHSVTQKLRLAVIPTFKGKDSRFGMNHAYPYEHLLDLCRKAGLVWMRDWSLKWHDIEPEKGKFTFDETDIQIDRPLKHDLKVLGMFPFASSLWSSEGGPGDPKAPVRTRLNVVARAPRDAKAMENFVQRTVRHYKGRVQWYQFLNEPLYTHYALPTAHGYTGKTYAELTIAFAKGARRADPDCKILAGIGGLSPTRHLNYFEEFFKAGGLKVIDAVDIHQYPATRSPEYMENWVNMLNKIMDKYGGRKPMWMTEFGYYADDDPTTVPMPYSGVLQPLRDENQQCAYYVRWVTTLVAAGVDKFFHHAGCADTLNRDAMQGIFFEYGGTTHKIYAAQAVLAQLLTPKRKFAGKMNLGNGIRGYMFADGDSSVIVVWAPFKKVTRKVRLTSNKLVLWDIMGRPQKTRSFTPAEMPMYVIGKGLSARELRMYLK